MFFGPPCPPSIHPWLPAFPSCIRCLCFGLAEVATGRGRNQIYHWPCTTKFIIGRGRNIIRLVDFMLDANIFEDLLSFLFFMTLSCLSNSFSTIRTFASGVCV